MLSGIEQTDKMYDKEIVSRMGEDFYNEVFLPKIKLLSSGKYTDFRDTVREELEPISDEYRNKVRSPKAPSSESGNTFRLSI